MKTIKQQNMDLDLRRFGHNLYTEALNSGSGDGGGSDSGSFLMNLIPNNYPKPNLFLVTKFEEDSSVDIDVTNYEIDDLLSLVAEDDIELFIICLYENSNLDKPIISRVQFSSREIIIEYFGTDVQIDVTNSEKVYNNKTYYVYYKNSNPK